MAHHDPEDVPGTAPEPAEVVGWFRLEELLEASGDMRLSRAWDQRVGRRVLLRVAAGESLRASHPVSHPEVCGPFPCMLLFPTKESTDAIAGGDVIRMSLLRAVHLRE